MLFVVLCFLETKGRDTTQCNATQRNVVILVVVVVVVCFLFPLVSPVIFLYLIGRRDDRIAIARIYIRVQERITLDD